MQKLSNQTLEITHKNIRQSLYFDVQINTPSPFLVMKNAQEWQDFWDNVLPAMEIPDWVKGDVAVFVFLGEELHGGTQAKLTTLDYQFAEDSATLSWKLWRDLDATSVAAFQDIWVVFTLNPQSNPIFSKLNKVVKVY